jgi:mercuric reductase
MNTYDLLIIGSGGAGMAAAIRGSELGARVAIVEGAPVVGGTCVNVGCIPSKNLIEAAKAYHTARTGFPGIMPCEPDVAWEAVQQQKHELVQGLRKEKYLDVLASYPNVTLLQGHARLLGEGRVRVGDEEFRAQKVIVATGASPAVPNIPGLAKTKVLTSTTAMELERLPASMMVIGAGAIGLELGQVFARFGTNVTILDIAERILPLEDADVSRALEQALAKEGIRFQLGVRVERVIQDAEGYAVSLEGEKGKETLRAEQLLVATGRLPNTKGLGLENLGVALDARGFIIVDEYMGTSHPDVFAAGDVTGSPQYVYVAALGGSVAAQAALAEISREKPIPLDLTATSRVTFTDPQVAAVGMMEAEANTAGYQPKVTSLPMTALPRAIVAHQPYGLIKMVADAKTDRLLGVHILAPNAGDVIGEAALAIKFDLTAQKLVSTLHPYLTWGEGLKLAAQTFTKDVARLSCCA